MGRAALFMVMGLGIAMGTISYNISGTTERALENNYTYYKYMYARNLARTAVHATLRGYDRNEDPDTTQVVSFADGEYQILSAQYSASPRDTVWLTAEGRFADTSYTMFVKLYRTTKPFPSVRSAIGIRASPITFDLIGQPSIDGRNYNADGTALTGSGDQPGVGVISSADSTAVMDEEAATSGDNIQGATEVQVDDSLANPADYIQEYLSNADYYLGPGTHGGTYGTAANPVIVVCDSPADTNFKVKFSGGTVGYGILAIRGNVEISGNFEWYGLVVVFGTQNVVNFGASGTPKIVGGLIVAQPGDGAASLTLKGTGANGKVLYSSAALTNARNIGKLRYYQIVYWYE
ncbi:MAG: hypothetical protein L0Y80_05510 [Ignavibacteriae bacterium]|nr:hypothetical protein [Ignavibacteriota bacterium]